MNFYNPYYYTMPMVNSGLGRGLLGGTLRSGLNWGTILNGAQRTLGLVNQAIPLVKQAAPMVRNAKTMFKVMNEFKKVETPNTNNTNNNFSNSDLSNNEQNTSYNEENIQMISDGGPTFFA